MVPIAHERTPGVKPQGPSTSPLAPLPALGKRLCRRRPIALTWGGKRGGGRWTAAVSTGFHLLTATRHAAIHAPPGTLDHAPLNVWKVHPRNSLERAFHTFRSEATKGCRQPPRHRPRGRPRSTARPGPHGHGVPEPRTGRTAAREDRPPAPDRTRRHRVRRRTRPARLRRQPCRRSGGRRRRPGCGTAHEGHSGQPAHSAHRSIPASGGRPHLVHSAITLRSFSCATLSRAPSGSGAHSTAGAAGRAVMRAETTAPALVRTGPSNGAASAARRRSAVQEV
jgi:hypothetical protein